MNPTTNSATNPNWSLRIAFSMMVACAAMLIGPQTYASECQAQYNAYLDAEQAVIDAHDANDAALANLAAARATGNIILIGPAIVWATFTQAVLSSAESDLRAAIAAVISACSPPSDD